MAQALAMATRGKQGITEVQASYLAGCFDADGSISITKSSPGSWGLRNGRIKNPRYVLRVNIVNTSHDLMNWLYENFGGLIKNRPLENPEKHRQTYDWSYDNGKALDVLELMYPYLIVKKERVALGLELLRGWKTNQGRGATTDPEEVVRRESYYQRMKSLNQFGPVQPQRLSPLAPVAQQDDAIV
jgi:hypothetical protein